MLDRMLWTWSWISWFHRFPPLHPSPRVSQSSPHNQASHGWAGEVNREQPIMTGTFLGWVEYQAESHWQTSPTHWPPTPGPPLSGVGGARPTSAWHGALHLRSELHNEIRSVTSAGVGIKRIKGRGSRHPLPQTWQHLSTAVWRLSCHVSVSYNKCYGLELERSRESQPDWRSTEDLMQISTKV